MRGATARSLQAALLLSSWSCVSAPPRVSRAALASFERREEEGQHISVRAFQAQEGGRLHLRVVHAGAVPGPARAVLPDERLKGMVEILDRRGRVLWSARYQPPELVEGIAASTLQLDLPLPNGATAVRLTERARGLDVVAPLAPASARARE